MMDRMGKHKTQNGLTFIMQNHLHQIDQTRLLVARLERISADSIWARRASGLRGALLRWLEKYGQPISQGPEYVEMSDQELQSISTLIDMSYKILEKAAKERLR
jgi:hypothetical protein